MPTPRALLLPVVALAAAIAATPAAAISPRNPYRSFNISGINYGSMQWEQAQREGRRVWPYYNTPTRVTGRSSGAWVGGVVGGGGGAGVIVQAGRPVAAPRQPARVYRRWRR
jgi:hypothetical protein